MPSGVETADRPLRRRHPFVGKLILVAEEGNDRRMLDPALVNAIRRTHDWFGRIHFRPDRPVRLTIDRLIRSSRLPLAWEDQRARLGFK